MSREAKLNAIFLLAILLLSLPGVIILVRKKLDPDARYMAEAPYIRRTEVYNNPVDAGTRSIRVVPPVTSGWVSELTNEHLGSAPLRREAPGGRVEPILSAGRHFEFLAAPEDAGGRTIALLAWLDDFGAGRVASVDADAEGGLLGELQEVSIQEIAVPPKVVDELQDGGFVVPPRRVAIVRLQFAAPTTPGITDAASQRLILRWRAGDESRQDVLDLARGLLARPGGAKETSGASTDQPTTRTGSPGA